MALPVKEFSLDSPEQFLSAVYPSREPCILRGVDIGPAPSLWTADYMSQICGHDHNVKVHVCSQRHMDFIGKNFIYRTLTFVEFLKRTEQQFHSNYFINPEERYYLRTLGDDPRKDIASFPLQFPELASDVRLPFELIGKDRMFSSVLRISSADCQLWTHYDVMDNFLIQIKGRKKVVLFHPKDALFLYLVGDKSTVLDIDSPDLQKYPLFSQAIRYQCELLPGNILYIPSLWFHNVLACDFSIAINMFWKHLEDKYYDPKDTYGNKDPPQAQRAMQIVERALKALEELPNDLYKDFYAKCMVNKIQQRCFKQ